MTETLGPTSADSFMQVVSEDNPADCHSRNRYDDLEERITRLTESWRAHASGARVKREHQYLRTDPTEVVRHRATDEPMEEGDLEEISVLQAMWLQEDS